MAVAETTDKPICVIWGSPVTDDEQAYELLLSSPKIVTFRTFANCIGAVRAYFDYHEFAARYRSPFDRRAVVGRSPIDPFGTRCRARVEGAARRVRHPGDPRRGRDVGAKRP